jgi:hypothetical protein
LVPVKCVYGEDGEGVEDDPDGDGTNRDCCTVADFTGLGDGAPCTYCHKMFKSKTHVRTHIEDLHFPTETPCAICEKVFLSKPKMLRHKSKKHPEAMDKRRSKRKKKTKKET